MRASRHVPRRSAASRLHTLPHKYITKHIYDINITRKDLVSVYVFGVEVADVLD